jgi:hypothetical protein
MIDALSHRLTNSAAARLKHFADLADKRALDLELERLKIRGATEIPTWTTRAQLETLYRLAASLPAGAKVSRVRFVPGCVHLLFSLREWLLGMAS